MGFNQYTMPKHDPVSGKWTFRVLDEEEKLIEQLEYNTETEARNEHRARFIKDVLDGRVTREAK